MPDRGARSETPTSRVGCVLDPAHNLPWKVSTQASRVITGLLLVRPTGSRFHEHPRIGAVIVLVLSTSRRGSGQARKP